IVVVPDGACAVAPGSAGYEAVVFAVFADVFCVCIIAKGAGIERGAGIQSEWANSRVWQWAGTKYRITAVTHIRGALQASNMYDPNLTHQGQTTCPHYPIKEMSKCGLELGDL